MSSAELNDYHFDVVYWTCMGSIPRTLASSQSVIGYDNRADSEGRVVSYGTPRDWVWDVVLFSENPSRYALQGFFPENISSCRSRHP